MQKIEWRSTLLIPAALAFLAAGQTACTRATPPPAATTSTAAKVVPVGTVKELMKGIVDPSSAVIWNAVGTASTKDGFVERRRWG